MSEVPTWIFEVVEPIPEIGGQAGDRIVVRPGDPDRPYALVRPLSHTDVRWAFGDRCRLLYTDPPGMTSGPSLRHLREQIPGPHGHLTLV